MEEFWEATVAQSFVAQMAFLAREGCSGRLNRWPVPGTAAVDDLCRRGDLPSSRTDEAEGSAARNRAGSSHSTGRRSRPMPTPVQPPGVGVALIDHSHVRNRCIGAEPDLSRFAIQLNGNPKTTTCRADFSERDLMTGVHEPQRASLVAGMVIRVKGLGGSRSHMAAALFVMAGSARPRHRRDWAQSDRLKRTSSRWRQPSARLPRAPSPEAIERGDHGNAIFYLVNGRLGRAAPLLC
jgi:hypothetical protein